MKVVVTGASGFLGSWICRILSGKHEVFALMREDSSEFRIKDIKPLTRLHICPNSWEKTLRELQPDAIIACHWSGVGNEDRNNASQFGNLRVFTEIAKYAADSNIFAFIGLGSQAELGPVNGPILETAIDNPTTEYGKAKVQLRLDLEKLFSNSSTRFAWARVFSTYGPLDSDGWLIPMVILRLLQNEEVNLTAGTQEWSFLHGIDAAFAIETILNTTSMNGIVHVANPETQNIRNAVTDIASQLGKVSLLKFGTIPFREDQVVSMIPICSKLVSAGWAPQVRFEQGISELISWMRGGNTFSWKDHEMKSKSISIPPRLQIR